MKPKTDVSHSKLHSSSRAQPLLHISDSKSTDMEVMMMIIIIISETDDLFIETF